MQRQLYVSHLLVDSHDKCKHFILVVLSQYLDQPRSPKTGLHTSKVRKKKPL